MQHNVQNKGGGSTAFWTMLKKCGFGEGWLPLFFLLFWYISFWDGEQFTLTFGRDGLLSIEATIVEENMFSLPSGYPTVESSAWNQFYCVQFANANTSTPAGMMWSKFPVSSIHIMLWRNIMFIFVQASAAPKLKEKKPNPLLSVISTLHCILLQWLWRKCVVMWYHYCTARPYEERTDHIFSSHSASSPNMF